MIFRAANDLEKNFPCDVCASQPTEAVVQYETKTCPQRRTTRDPFHICYQCATLLGMISSNSKYPPQEVTVLEDFPEKT